MAIDVTEGYISPVWGEASIEAIYVKDCVVGDVLDIITYARFQTEFFLQLQFYRGLNFPFSY